MDFVAPPKNPFAIDGRSWTANELRMLKHLTTKHIRHHTTYFFLEREAHKFIYAAHHGVLMDTLMRVVHGEIKRLIINLPPGYTKCVTGGTKIMLADGSQVPAEHIKPGDTLMSYRKGGRLAACNVVATEDFEKRCVKVTTAHNRSITVGHDHPALTQRGWVNAEDLTTDHYLIHVNVDHYIEYLDVVPNTLMHDQVASVIDGGEQRVYHIGVDADAYDDKNFIANGFVVHNTELAVIHFITYGLSINSQARFMHLSYSDTLALGNSQAARDVVESEEFQVLHPMKIRPDVSSKKKWWTEHGGGTYAASAGGPVTGFRAGRMMPGFSGALIIDDPIKPEDYQSDVEREKINRRFNSTFKSRLAHEDIPIILIMQRVGIEDPTGFLLNGGTGEKWHHLRLPVRVKRRREPYDNKKWPYGIEIEHRLKHGPLWHAKHDNDQIKLLETSDPITYDAQYDQDPRKDGGTMFEKEFFEVVDSIPTGGISVRGWDLAASDGKASPFTVGVKMTWMDRIFYIEHVIRFQKGPLEVENAIKAVASADGWGTIIDIPQDPGQAGKSQVAYMLTKLVGYDVKYSVESGSKQTRASGLAAQAKAGNVKLLRGDWNAEYLNEVSRFPSSKFKDQVDASSRAFHRIVEEIIHEGHSIRVGRTKGVY